MTAFLKSLELILALTALVAAVGWAISECK